MTKKNLLIIICFTIFSCSNVETLNLLTDSYEFATYIDFFNKEDNNLKIYTKITANIDNELELNKNSYDIIVSKNLFFNKKSYNLKQIKILNRQDFYENIVESDTVFPLNFNLDVIAYNKKNSSLINNNQLTINLEKMLNFSKNFNKKNRLDEYTNIAFSFLWNNEFIFKYLEYKNVHWQNKNKKIYVDKQNLMAELKNLNSLYHSYFENSEKEQKFKKKYLYDTAENLLLNNRILFYHLTLSDFIKIQKEKRENLDFFIYSESDKIFISNNSLYFGILKKHKYGKKVLNWFIDPENQKKLIEAGELKWVNSFGFANGLSILYKMNEEYISKIAPQLKHSIPNKKIVYKTYETPKNWNEIKNSTIFPWISVSILSNKITDYPYNDNQLLKTFK